jgi:hypothetical protein
VVSRQAAGSLLPSHSLLAAAAVHGCVQLVAAACAKDSGGA